MFDVYLTLISYLKNQRAQNAPTCLLLVFIGLTQRVQQCLLYCVILLSTYFSDIKLTERLLIIPIHSKTFNLTLAMNANNDLKGKAKSLHWFLLQCKRSYWSENSHNLRLGFKCSKT